MANNRMYLKCECGERILLAKYYPDTNWYIWVGNYTDAERVSQIDEWFDKHRHEDSNCYNIKKGGTNFGIEYEAD